MNAYANIKDISDEKISDFIDDFLLTEEGIQAKVHEIISATILIERFDDFVKDSFLRAEIDLELAARMVIGCTYYNNMKEEDKTTKGIANVLIRLLNSQILDVDKLDYIIRDTKMSGYDNVNLDVTRLVRSVTAIEKAMEYFRLTAKKCLAQLTIFSERKNRKICG